MISMTNVAMKLIIFAVYMSLNDGFFDIYD